MFFFIVCSKNQRVVIISSYPQSHVIIHQVMINMRQCGTNQSQDLDARRKRQAQLSMLRGMLLLLFLVNSTSSYITVFLTEQEVLTTSTFIHQFQLLILHPLQQSFSVFTFPVNSFMCQSCCTRYYSIYTHPAVFFSECFHPSQSSTLLNLSLPQGN